MIGGIVSPFPAVRVRVSNLSTTEFNNAHSTVMILVLCSSGTIVVISAADSDFTLLRLHQRVTVRNRYHELKYVVGVT